MSESAPICVPVELRLARSGPRAASFRRWFRLASAVSEGGIAFAHPLPDEIGGEGKDTPPVGVAFYLPGDEQPIVLDGRAVDVPSAARGGDDRPRRQAIRFLHATTEITAAERDRIRRYVETRLGA